MSKNPILDCLIVGAGPAGLTSAIYLARFRRNIALYDSGTSRAALIPISHNYPGFPEGVSGVDFLQALHHQAEIYGVPIMQEEILSLQKTDDFFIARTGSQEIRAHNVLLATGVVDEKPSFQGLPKSIYNGVIRFCPICDGFEAINKRIGVMGPLSTVIPKSLFLRTYTPYVFMFVTRMDIKPDEQMQTDMKAAGLKVPANLVLGITPNAHCITVTLENGDAITIDILYPAMGAEVKSQLATQLGAEADIKGHLKADSSQCTSIKGLYTAGDLTQDISQIAVATGQAAIAATAIHNSLPKLYVR
jgi:thioredoxin reductase (NADPH)